MMSVLSSLANSQGRRDEEPNKELARHIVDKNDTTAVEELVQLLQHKDKNIQSDSIKVLYEVGVEKPELLAPYIKVFVQLLHIKNNRLVWGAMAALNAVATVKAEEVYQNLSLILDAANKGSVIAKDHAVKIMVQLAKVPAYTSDTLTLLIDQLKDAPLNQLPSYVELTATVVTSEHKTELSRVLQQRLPEVEQESKCKRLEKVLKKLQK
ncbi:hypothetical protein [Pontibacter cellulosilyticus]|uniref:HEAT repeat domain-containing protein n=1 Tax=Pontibacter cellulosilyticus TaxID=1720253 RepID=A0A923N6P7_9BACT|nr:hypothetical protein [Pontibacter cellulosilyticus]MBC5992742.1 hypothetical protein [Pontibacter cellulosilyticus]